MACVRASGPFSRIRVANGNIEDSIALIDVSNAGDEPRWASYLEPLTADEAQDQRCVRDDIGPRPGTSVRLGDEHGALLVASLPACAALVFAGLPSDAQQDRPFRIALLGGGKVRSTELNSFLTRVTQSDTPPDFLYFMDLPHLRNASAPLDALDAMMRELGLPWGILFSPASARRGYEGFIDRFGSLDYVVSVHGVPLLVLDTASAGLSSPQRNEVEALRVCEAGCAPGVALMSIPPVSTHRLDVGMFHSQAVAQELVSRLISRGIRHLVSSTEDVPRTEAIAQLALTDVGALRLDDAYLELRIEPALPGARLCDDGVSLQTSSTVTVRPASIICEEREACVEGVCVPRCGGIHGACAGGRLCDGAGYCQRPCDANCPADRCSSRGVCLEGPQLRLVDRAL